jgi:uncharacterized protein (UPF0332 family)
MEPLTKLYLERAKNELILGQTIFKISWNKKIKEQLTLTKDITFYSGAIVHAYYCIFFSAKAYLNENNIKTTKPGIHHKTFHEFKKFVDSGKLNQELLELYEEMLIKAEELLQIFFKEKRKRGFFNYERLPEANRKPAEKSLNNASIFFKSLNKILESK